MLTSTFSCDSLKHGSGKFGPVQLITRRKCSTQPVKSKFTTRVYFSIHVMSHDSEFGSVLLGLHPWLTLQIYSMNREKLYQYQHYSYKFLSLFILSSNCSLDWVKILKHFSDYLKLCIEPHFHGLIDDCITRN